MDKNLMKTKIILIEFKTFDRTFFNETVITIYRSESLQEKLIT